jgi:MFS family permease
MKTSHPAFFMFLIAPFGAASGFTGVSLAYLLTQAQVSAEAVSGLVALSYLPQTWKFLWAPVVDLTLNRKAWYGIGLAGTLTGMLGVGASPLDSAAMAPLTAWVLVMSAASTLLAMAVESLMAHQTGDDEKGRAAGWSQAGNLGGTGLGGGAALWLVQSGGLSSTLGAAVLAGLCLACAWPLLFITDTPRAAVQARIGEHLRDMLRDLGSVLRSRRGELALTVPATLLFLGVRHWSGRRG